MNNLPNHDGLRGSDQSAKEKEEESREEENLEDEDGEDEEEQTDEMENELNIEEDYKDPHNNTLLHESDDAMKELLSREGESEKESLTKQRGWEEMTSHDLLVAKHNRHATTKETSSSRNDINSKHDTNDKIQGSLYETLKHTIKDFLFSSSVENRVFDGIEWSYVDFDRKHKFVHHSPDKSAYPPPAIFDEEFEDENVNVGEIFVSLPSFRGETQAIIMLLHSIIIFGEALDSCHKLIG